MVPTVSEQRPKNFNKRIEQLTLAEMALLAGLVKAPSRYSPINNLRRAKGRQSYVLTRMADVGFITSKKRTEPFERL